MSEKFASRFPVLSAGSPFTDDNLSSKKLVPGFQFKSARASKTSKWNGSYGKATPESALLAVQYVTSTFVNAPVKLRVKPTRQDLEERLELCALACCIHAWAVLPYFDSYILVSMV